MNKIKIDTILFDMDGVVIDSEKLHMKAMDQSLEKNNISYDKSILNNYVGRSDESFYNYIYDNIDSSVEVDKLINEKNQIFENLLKELEYVDGFTDFMQVVKRNNVRAGVVTSSSKFTVDKVDEVVKIKSFFETFVTEEDTQKHKPNPDPFIEGLKRFNADKSKTLVIEDSISGVISGKKAGCVTAGLTTSFEANVLMDAGADFAVGSYNEILEKIQF